MFVLFKKEVNTFSSSNIRRSSFLSVERNLVCSKLPVQNIDFMVRITYPSPSHRRKPPHLFSHMQQLEESCQCTGEEYGNQRGGGGKYQIFFRGKRKAKRILRGGLVVVEPAIKIVFGIWLVPIVIGPKVSITGHRERAFQVLENLLGIPLRYGTVTPVSVARIACSLLQDCGEGGGVSLSTK